MNFWIVFFLFNSSTTRPVTSEPLLTKFTQLITNFVFNVFVILCTEITLTNDPKDEVFTISLKNMFHVHIYPHDCIKLLNFRQQL